MSKQRSSNSSVSQLRIIAGKWRGRKLPIPVVAGLRPTGDRIRETLFNWLAPDITGAVCLDLFAGAGALGFESLSRGANAVTLCERNAVAAKQLQDNARTLNATGATVLQIDSISMLASPPTAKYNIVFIDPPFDLQLWQQAIDALDKQAWLAPQAAIYIESGLDAHYIVPSHWHLHREKHAGAVRYCLYYLDRAGAE